VQFSYFEEPMSNPSRPTKPPEREKLLMTASKDPNSKNIAIPFFLIQFYVHVQTFSSKCENSTVTWINYYF
jgi:hypothetical protein